MARLLTTPEVQPDGTQQAIIRIRLDIPHRRNAADDAMEINKPQVQLWYEVITYDANGLGIDRQESVVALAGWPPNFKADARSLYERVHVHAESVGLIAGVGTDEPLD